MKTKTEQRERIYAIINKPVGRGKNRYWKAFSFNRRDNQDDVQAFMYAVHVSINDYFLHYESQLELVKPSFGCSVPFFFYTSKRYGRFWVNDTPVTVFYDWKKINGKKLLVNRIYQLE